MDQGEKIRRVEDACCLLMPHVAIPKVGELIYWLSYVPFVEQINKTWHPLPFSKGDLLLRRTTLVDVVKCGPKQTTLERNLRREILPTEYVHKAYLWVPASQRKVIMNEIVKYVAEMDRKAMPHSAISGQAWWYLPMIVRVWEALGFFKNEKAAIAVWQQETEDELF